MPNSPQQQLLVVGFGAMGSAIIHGGLAAGVLHPHDVIVCEPDAARRKAALDAGFFAVESAARLPDDTRPGHVLLAVKPQAFASAAKDLNALGLDSTCDVISIMAGVPASRIREALDARPTVVRAMPNLGAQVRQGITAIASGGGGGADARFAHTLFSAVGRVVRIDESLMDAFTAVAGSGPAYLFLLAEAMIAGAVRMGMPADVADEAVRQTLLGAATLLRESDKPPADLRAAVTSKGGTTAAALTVLDDAQVHDAWVRAIEAATKRGAELSKLS